MTIRLNMYQIDAFTDKPFSGNPAAVCPLEEWLSDELMQNIAAENNLSETAFFAPQTDGHYLIRWFTPQIEVALCGHATLASAFVFFNYINPSASKIVFETVKSGQLLVTREQNKLVLDFPLYPIKNSTETNKLSAAKAIFSDNLVELLDDGMNSYVAVLNSAQAVSDFNPNISELLEHGFQYLMITASSEKQDVDFISRFFAPGAGIAEDPVTGSAHCRLAPYWAQIIGKQNLVAQQVSARGGTIWCSVQDDRVILKGQVCLVLESELILPATTS